MWCSHRNYSILVILSLWGLATCRHCDHHHFWDLKNKMCQPCAKCPMNEITRKPCGRRTNTVCGPFREFNFFNQLDNLDSSYSSYEYEGSIGENSSGRTHSKEHPKKTNDVQNEPIVEKDDGEYWKNLAFALIGVVCILIFVATVVVLMACRKLHESAAVKRSEEEEDDDSGYVVIRAIRPPNMMRRPHPPTSNVSQSPSAMALLAPNANQNVSQDADHFTQTRRPDWHLRGTYKPKSRLLTYDADDVFESEDSSGSRTSGKVPLHPIPERSFSSDSGDSTHSSHEIPV